MARARNFDAIECLFSNGLWVPGRLVMFVGEVDSQACARFLAGITVLAESPEPIFITLNSCGGSAVDGIAIYDAVSKLSNHVTITVYGEAASMGAVILQAADQRLMAPHATVMIHDGTDSVSDLHQRDFERRAEEGKRTREEMYGIFASKTQRDKAYWRRKLQRDCYFNAEQALKEGLIDGIAQRP